MGLKRNYKGSNYSKKRKTRKKTKNKRKLPNKRKITKYRRNKTIKNKHKMKGGMEGASAVPYEMETFRLPHGEETIFQNDKCVCWMELKKMVSM